ncbi:MAG: type I glyceraldehyde-3-phosphate dehydrogenase [Bacteriovoracaceae bacterium]|nr:type I glyceraldehyde-3-phosphate dehydrogenase [Bacteriovoracaceae bacterium]
MSTTRIGINGMGRIGRTVLREIINRNEGKIEVVAVNNPGNSDEYIHLLKYDSVHGKFGAEVKFEDDTININGKSIKFYSERDPSAIAWSDQQVDVVIDATGVFKDKDGLGKHLSGTVKKVIMCAPGKDLDGTFVVGINHEDYSPADHNIISNASCTTNCLAPVAKVLNDKFGIKSGLMTTIHAYTSDQQLLDGSHRDPRRARAAAMSMIPTTTGAAKAVGLVIPELKGKLDGYAVRVPTPNVSMVDLTVSLNTAATEAEINAALKEASNSSLKGVLRYEEELLVSIDFCGMRESSCVDSTLTNVVDDKVKVVAWYDNEAGFSNRVIDLATYVGSKL